MGSIIRFGIRLFPTASSNILVLRYVIFLDGRTSGYLIIPLLHECWLYGLHLLGRVDGYTVRVDAFGCAVPDLQLLVQAVDEVNLVVHCWLVLAVGALPIFV